MKSFLHLSFTHSLGLASVHLRQFATHATHLSLLGSFDPLKNPSLHSEHFLSLLHFLQLPPQSVHVLAELS